MAMAEFSMDNLNKCLCPVCPVQVKSACSKDMLNKLNQAQGMPKPEDVPGLYCASGKASCTDLSATKQCVCTGCMVWAENQLASNHYCAYGSAAETR